MGEILLLNEKLAGSCHSPNTCSRPALRGLRTSSTPIFRKRTIQSKVFLYFALSRPACTCSSLPALHTSALIPSFRGYSSLIESGFTKLYLYDTWGSAAV